MKKGIYSFNGLPDDWFVIMSYTSKVMEECNFSKMDIFKYEEYCNKTIKNFRQVAYNIIAKCNLIAFKERQERKKNEKNIANNVINNDIII